MSSENASRRKFITSLAFGSLVLPAQALPYPLYENQTLEKPESDKLFYRYPALDDNSVAAVVGAAHSNFDKVKELVTRRPELAKATWDWGFGDYESALGAAAHMGRKDIAEYLMSQGARADIFTFAMLGKIDVVKSIIAASPGIQQTHGPHGFTLLMHAKSRLWDKDINASDKAKANEMIAYLESLGDAHLPAKSLPMSEEEQKAYLGEYRWGPAEDEVFIVELNTRRKVLNIGKKETFGRTLHKIDEHLFAPSGGPSVRINFKVENNQVVSLTIHEPDPVMTAVRV